MGAHRVFRRPSYQQADRLPISTYDEAIRRLVVVRVDPSVTDEAYSLACTIVADIFWTSDKRVHSDAAKMQRELVGA